MSELKQTSHADKQILLMFLGGVPNTTNIIDHWKIMNENFSKKDNFYLVIHPISIDDNYIPDIGFVSIFKKENVYVVDNEHHLKTAWATRSLSDATLMMMQYAHKRNNNKMFDKYILLSATCCPIYTLDKIYNRITRTIKHFDEKTNTFVYENNNEKSWIYGYTIKQDYRGSYNTIKSFLIYYQFKFSQWMILDKKHASYFFEKDNPADTYILSKNEEKCTSVSINYIEYKNKDKDYIEKNFDSYLNLYKYCDISDELFFGYYIFYKLINANTSGEQIRFLDQYRSQIPKNIECMENFDELLFRLNDVPDNIKSTIKNIDDVNKSKINFLGSLVTRLPPNKCWRDDKYYENLLLDLSKITKFDENSQLFIMSTYTDWYRSCISPHNLFRGFTNFGKKSINIAEFLNLRYEPDELKTYINDNIIENDCLYTKNKYNVITLLSSNIFLHIASHPAEYVTWTLRNIVNAYILLSCILCMFTLGFQKNTLGVNNFDFLWQIFVLYKNIICEEFSIGSYDFIDDTFTSITYDEYLIKNNKVVEQLNNKFIIDSDVYIKLDKIYGTPITGNVLLEAMTSGSLFIRKCYDSSMIQTYSNILKQCETDYRPMNIVPPISKTIPNIGDTNGIFTEMMSLKEKNVEQKGEIVSIHSGGSYYNEYRNTKQKYLQLKNN
jgi:hypothetical protein